MKTFPVDDLRTVLRDVFLSRGLTRLHAEYVVDGMLYASLRGIDTHGIRLAPTYVAELDGGRSIVRPDMEIVNEGSAVSLLHGGGALGMVAGRLAVDEAVSVGTRFGIGAVSIRNSNHFGAAGFFASTIAERGLIGIVLSNSDALVAPTDGLLPLWGTNPLSIAARGRGNDLFCLDMACSQVSFSKVLHARAAEGCAIRGWATDHNGQDIADADGDRDIRALLPLGGYKGHGLAMAVSILCCLLADTPFDWELSHLYEPPFDRPRDISHTFVAVDPRSFTDPDRFTQRLSRMMEIVRTQMALYDDRAVRCPGDHEVAIKDERTANGIPIHDDDLEKLRLLGPNGFFDY